MAIHKKLKTSIDGDCLSDAGNNSEVIDVDFEALPLCEDDRTGIEEMLKLQFDKFSMNWTSLTNHLLSLKGIGSILKQVFADDEDCGDNDDENETVFGLSHLVNLTLHKGIECVDSIRNMLSSLVEEHVNDEVLKNSLRDVFDNDNSEAQLAFVINARLDIFPSSISYQLFKCLFEEITKNHYNCSKLVFMSKIFKSELGSSESDVEYVNLEDRIFSLHASLVFDAKIVSDADTPALNTDHGTFLPYRRILVVSTDKIPIILSDLQKDM